MKPSCNPCNQECRQGRDCPAKVVRPVEFRLIPADWSRSGKPKAVLQSLRSVFKKSPSSERPVS